MTSDRRAHDQRTHIRSSGKDPPDKSRNIDQAPSYEDEGGVTTDVGLPPQQDSLSVAALAVMPEIRPHVVLLGKAGPHEVKVMIDNGATSNFCHNDLSQKLPKTRLDSQWALGNFSGKRSHSTNTIAKDRQPKFERPL